MIHQRASAAPGPWNTAIRGPHAEKLEIVKEPRATPRRNLVCLRNFPLRPPIPIESAASGRKSWGKQVREMHDQLFENQRSLERENLVEYAKLIGLDLARFIQEMNQHRYAKRVHEDFLSGVRSGVNGTPTFFVNGIRHDGSYEMGSLLAAIRRAGGESS